MYRQCTGDIDSDAQAPDQAVDRSGRNPNARWRAAGCRSSFDVDRPTMSASSFQLSLRDFLYVPMGRAMALAIGGALIDRDSAT